MERGPGHEKWAKYMPWVLYGAAGSGKSELMKWLETRIGQEDPARATAAIRIARTELDVLSIAERFRALLSEGFFGETTRRRWQVARRKPRTVTKLLLLSALESLLDSDEAINALFYRLLNAVQPHVERALTIGEAEAPYRSVELMSQETWEAIINETAIATPQRALARLADQLGMTTAADLALSLYALSLVAGGLPPERPPGFDDDFWEQAGRAHVQLCGQRVQMDEKLCQTIRHLFEDFFKLRENVYDGPRIARLLSGRGPEALLDTLLRVDVARLDTGYRLGGTPLRDVLTTAQGMIRRWERTDGGGDTLSPSTQGVLDALLSGDGEGVPLRQVPTETLIELRAARPDLYATLRIVTARSPEG